MSYANMGLSNETEALDFLGEILDDTVFQVRGNAFARYFWYGVVVFITIAAICNIVQLTTLKTRYALLIACCVKGPDGIT
jgi:ferric-chelate reductase